METNILSNLQHIFWFIQDGGQAHFLLGILKYLNLRLSHWWIGPESEFAYQHAELNITHKNLIETTFLAYSEPMTSR